MEVHSDTPQKAVMGVLNAVLMDGDWFAPRGMRTLEKRNVTVFVRKPWLIPFKLPHRNPPLSRQIAGFEIATLIGQVAADTVAPRQLQRFADRGIMHGVYGLRVRGQLMKIIALLEKDIESRQAVINIFDHRTDLGADSRDIPCTIAVQFFVRNEMLHMRSVMRSNDAWLGLPYDLMQFCALQCFMAQCLGLSPGTYTHSVGSMHIYDRDYPSACAFVNHKYEWMDEWPFEWMFTDTLLGAYDDGVRFCQDVLFGRPVQPQTKFERFLADALGWEHSDPRPSAS